MECIVNMVWQYQQQGEILPNIPIGNLKKAYCIGAVWQIIL
jgi:hypothetical protein